MPLTRALHAPPLWYEAPAELSRRPLLIGPPRPLNRQRRIPLNQRPPPLSPPSPMQISHQRLQTKPKKKPPRSQGQKEPGPGSENRRSQPRLSPTASPSRRSPRADALKAGVASPEERIDQWSAACRVVAQRSARQPRPISLCHRPGTRPRMIR